MVNVPTLGQNVYNIPTVNPYGVITAEKSPNYITVTDNRIDTALNPCFAEVCSIGVDTGSSYRYTFIDLGGRLYCNNVEIDLAVIRQSFQPPWLGKSIAIFDAYFLEAVLVIKSELECISFSNCIIDRLAFCMASERCIPTKLFIDGVEYSLDPYVQQDDNVAKLVYGQDMSDLKSDKITINAYVDLSLRSQFFEAPKPYSSYNIPNYPVDNKSKIGNNSCTYTYK